MWNRLLGDFSVSEIKKSGNIRYILPDDGTKNEGLPFFKDIKTA